MSEPVYVHQGPDKRFSGWFGQLLANLQWKLSFQSVEPPVSYIWRYGRCRVGVEFSQPGNKPFFLLFIPHLRYVDKQRWYSFRMGWRWDDNWPGYIADVIVKMRIDNLVE